MVCYVASVEISFCNISSFSFTVALFAVDKFPLVQNLRWKTVDYSQLIELVVSGERGREEGREKERKKERHKTVRLWIIVL
jgi:hypothetical protein